MAALRQPNFLIYSIGRVASGMGMTMLNAAIAWQVYEISGSAFQLAMIGLARFGPSLGLTLVGGAVADGHDRRRIVMLTQLAPLLTSLTLFLLTISDSVHLPVIYGLVLFVAIASAFENPARQAFLPQVVTKETFANAIIVSSTLQSFAFVTGPSVGGLLIGTVGVDGAYAAHMTLIVVSLVSLAFLTLREQDGPRRAVSLSAIKEGVQFVWHRQVLLGAMTLDMFAVIFGGATALLPIYAKDILEVGVVAFVDDVVIRCNATTKIAHHLEIALIADDHVVPVIDRLAGAAACAEVVDGGRQRCFGRLPGHDAIFQLGSVVDPMQCFRLCNRNRRRCRAKPFEVIRAMQYSGNHGQ